MREERPTETEDTPVNAGGGNASSPDPYDDYEESMPVDPPVNQGGGGT